MKKLHLLAALLTAGFISCATVSCGETKPSDTESGQTDNGGNGGNGGNTDNGGSDATVPGGKISISKALEIGEALADKTKTDDKYTLSGTVEKFVEGHKSFFLTDGSSNVKVFMFDEDYEKLSADKKYDVYDSVVVKGYIQKYNNKIEIKKPEIISVTKSGSTAPDTGDTEQGGGSTTNAPSFDDLTGALTVKEAYNLVKDLPAKGTAGFKYVYGTVGGKLNTTYGNCDLVDSDGSTKLFLFGEKSKFNANKYAVGDKILVYGEVVHFKDTKNESFQITKPDIIEVKKAA